MTDTSLRLPDVGQGDPAGGAAALAGIRVADLTIVTAGASATQIMADFGADVIKVESARWIDPFRRWDGEGPREPRPEPWNDSPPFQCVNRNKRSMALDLKQEKGREAFLRLVAVSDIVAQNFRVGVLERLGLGFDELRGVNEDILLVSLTSQGLSGPESRYSSFGSTLDALSGLMSITGYDPETPVWSSNEVNYPDQVVSTLGAALMLVALRQRDRTGEAVNIDLSQRELVTSMIGEIVLDFTANGHIARPAANRDFSMAPHGVYPCRGEDAWIAITVSDDGEWASLAAVMGEILGPVPGRFATFPGRWHHLDELDELVSAWTREQDREEAAALLQRHGVCAGPVLPGKDVWRDPNLAARDFFTEVVHPVTGPQRQRTWPFRLARTGGSVRRRAPLLGEHTEEILRDILHYDAAEIAELAALGVTDNRPPS
jgi:crotonobetainyl-CoA:carnitine CoA-transferase CaiB-like acyl-CoA transferase